MDTDQQTHNLRILVAWEAGEITIGQAKMLMELWGGTPVDYVDIRRMRENIVAQVGAIWRDEFRDRHAIEPKE